MRVKEKGSRAAQHNVGRRNCEKISALERKADRYLEAEVQYSGNRYTHDIGTAIGR